MKILIILILSISVITGYSQCNKELSDIAISKLKPNYTFQKEVKVKLKKDKNVAKGKPAEKIIQNLVLTAGQNYMFYSQNSSENLTKVIFELNLGTRIIGRSYLNGRHYKGISFMCTKTGTYNLSYNYEKGEAGCSVIVVSSVKF